MEPFRFFPVRASTIAPQVDALFWALVALSAFFALGIGAAIVYFALRYRHTNRDVARAHALRDTPLLETGIILGLLVPATGAFLWAGTLYFDVKTPPPGTSLDLYGTGKQWMWKFQHPNGVREINTLHVPVGRTVRLTLTSEDAIHSFFVPAFRVKQDVLPGRYTHAWFTATLPGRYHLFCAEYCGTEHSGMGGWVEVMEPGAYEQWLDGGARQDADGAMAAAARADAAPAPGAPAATPQRMADAGAALFSRLRCNTCHRTDTLALYPSQGPALAGVYGRVVRLGDGRRVLADEQYLRESILYPQARLAQGYPPIMPTYQGQVDEDELLQLVAFIKSLADAPPAATPPPARP